VFSKRLILRLPSASSSLAATSTSVSSGSGNEVPHLLKFSVYLVDNDMKVADDSRLACITLQLRELFNLNTVYGNTNTNASGTSTSVTGTDTPATVTTSAVAMRTWSGREVVIPLRNNDRSDIDNALQLSNAVIILKCAPLRRVSMHMTPSFKRQGHDHHIAVAATTASAPLPSHQPLTPLPLPLPLQSQSSAPLPSVSIPTQMDKSKDHLPWHISIEAK
jgi:hypothetical protein